jgi:hypothetical protein
VYAGEVSRFFETRWLLVGGAKSIGATGAPEAAFGGTAYSMEYNGARTTLTEERVKALRKILPD